LGNETKAETWKIEIHKLPLPLKLTTKIKMRTQVQQVNYNQVLGFVGKLSENEKEKLFFTLRNDRVKNLLAKLRESAKGMSLTFEEITDEVEIVRAARYENKSEK